MKEGLSQLSFNSIEINVPTSGCNIDGGSNSPNTTHQELPPDPDSELHPDIKSDQYKLPPPMSDCVLPVPFEHTLELPKK